MTKISRKFLQTLYGDEHEFQRLSDKPMNKTAGENKGMSEQRRNLFRQRLHENLVKKANERFLAPADLRSVDPHGEYLRRAKVLDKTGSEMAHKDMILAAQAFHTLKTHGQREKRLKQEQKG